MATLSSILAWRIPWTEKLGRLWSKSRFLTRIDVKARAGEKIYISNYIVFILP